MDRTLLEQLADSGTALICNALDALKISTPYFDGTISCLSPGLGPLVGQAVTIKLDSSSPGDAHEMDAFWRMVEEIEKSPLPRIIVVETTGADRYRECVMGDGLAKLFLSVGAVGLVTDGGMRDIQEIIDEGFKVFGLGPVVQHRAMRWSGLNETVRVAGNEVRTGDLIHGDRDGCIVVPEASFPKIVKACRIVMDYEKMSHSLLRQTGRPLTERLREREKAAKMRDERMLDIKDGGY